MTQSTDLESRVRALEDRMMADLATKDDINLIREDFKSDTNLIHEDIKTVHERIDRILLNMATRSDIRMLTQTGLGIIGTLIIALVVLIGTGIIN